MAQKPTSAQLDQATPPAGLGAHHDRAYLDRLSGTWKYEDDDGQEWEWQLIPVQPTPKQPSEPPHAAHGHSPQDQAVSPHLPSTSASDASTLSATERPGRWVRVVDDELIRAQQAAYGSNDADASHDIVDAGTSTAPSAAVKQNKKRKAGADGPSSSAAGGHHTTTAPNKKPKPVTSLYITGLPLDCTADEIASVFSRYGLLLEDDEGKPRIKMYRDQATGQFKGEALVVYFKPESVDLAINLLDDTCLRAATGQTSGPRMQVQRAQFPSASDVQKGNGPSADAKPPAASAPSEHPSSNPQPAGSSDKSGAPSSSQQLDAGGAVSRRNLSDQERRRIQKRVARMEDKLTGWDSSDEDSAAPSNSAAPPQARTVVLKKMFTLVELDEDPTLLLDLKEDVREECEGIGRVTNVVLWDREPEGVMTIKFADPLAAAECVKKMDGRYFAGRRIDAFLIGSKPRFRKSDKAGNDDDNDEEDGGDKRRVDAFGAWLENADG
ncbi:uncharacterized protein PFL1_03306 [Pseudozyma flocculosa PF-1]|uniref:Related to Splicing factor U2AF-associated protein 2 n=2 Tax=Pseudozyma flocculosa TaxID=84751 RepID=A0A5C3F756_9BASI|nr:uncharacterized protein PFL1_03306 [Pseudozyma flocculosa PF-1]EPQ29016.1 hypothetical protein PFL1_03306 [Pseudozyma flocculosa PF-1]SPO40010.1 related to Splicing factor U2AF-associated protein 2 [Pseudozyma flocculosa]